MREVKVHSPDYKGVEADEVCIKQFLSYRSHAFHCAGRDSFAVVFFSVVIF